MDNSITLGQVLLNDAVAGNREAIRREKQAQEAKPREKTEIPAGDKLAMRRRAELVQSISDGRAHIAHLQRKEIPLVRELKVLGITKDIEGAAVKLGLCQAD